MGESHTPLLADTVDVESLQKLLVVPPKYNYQWGNKIRAILNDMIEITK